MANQEHQHQHDKDHNQAHTQSQTWGTWEELLLAAAVKRHGLKNWDLVASEIRTKTSLPLVLTTAQDCELKYHDLHQRFTASSSPRPRPQEEDRQVVVAAKEQPAPVLLLCNNTNNKDFQDTFCGDIPWLEELRKLRVAELKQEVHRYDVSILSLQLKVKRLEEERGEKLKEDVKKESSAADLIEKRSENQKKREEENGSVNESNSTGEEEEEEEEKEGTKLKEEGEDSGGGGGGCGGDSVTQESWASLSGQQRTRTINKKSEPLTAVLDMIRSHSHASFFQALSLTHSQEVKLYQDMVRQHIDLETIQTRVDQGSYSSNLAFYRDLLLLFNNVILFFPDTSLQSLAAHQLRSLVSDQLRNRTQQSPNHTTPHPTSTSELEASDSLLPKNKSSLPNPILFSRKRSSVSAKPSDSTSTQNQQLTDQKPSSDLRPPVLQHKAKPKDKPVTGARSSRRSKKTFSRPPATPPKGPHTTPATKVGTADKPEASSSRKKTETSSLDKKRSAADFLKRIKKNSPVETLKKRNTKKNRAVGGVGVDEVHKKGLKGKESGLRKNSDKQQAKEENSSSVRRNTGRPLKKVAAEGSSSRVVSAKRGRESSGGKEPADGGKKPRKRSNR
ncbi:hypothetical protein K2173_011357 [Erythroxylum novogranatense]|uniref:Bromo domain-containing protein n=1 Tax=Erythroxylum novogranatense TaxID=1862640 RepID=A0AAV8S9U3_9ROSI|nr:hypothetical protein K2173_011357 [Erythroxylum novogranatense]